MKFLIMILGLGLGLFAGLYKGVERPRGFLWKITVVAAVAVAALMSLMPPIAADPFVLKSLASEGDDAPLAVRFKIAPGTMKTFKKDSVYVQFKITPVETGAEKEEYDMYLRVDSKLYPYVEKAEDSFIAVLAFSKKHKLFFVHSLEYVNPWITLPYVPTLGERMRILNFHVPVAWIAALAYLLSMFYSIQYLRKKDAVYDIKASSSAALGTLFCILATVTGMIWAKFNWGHFWNWDPRETSIFILLLIYLAYFTLRAAVDREDVKAKLSAVYDIMAAVTVPFFIFVLPRITTGLHPGSASEADSGPVLSASSDMLNNVKQFTFALSLGAYTAFFFWALNILIRYRIIKTELTDREY